MNTSTLCVAKTLNPTAENPLCFSCGPATVAEVLDWIASSSASTLVMDFSQVNTIHSNLLLSLVQAYQQATSLGKILVLRSLSPEFRIALEISQLDQLFPVS